MRKIIIFVFLVLPILLNSCDQTGKTSNIDDAINNSDALKLKVKVVNESSKDPQLIIAVVNESTEPLFVAGVDDVSNDLSFHVKGGSELLYDTDVFGSVIYKRMNLLLPRGERVVSFGDIFDDCSIEDRSKNLSENVTVRLRIHHANFDTGRCGIQTLESDFIEIPKYLLNNFRERGSNNKKAARTYLLPDLPKIP